MRVGQSHSGLSLFPTIVPTPPTPPPPVQNPFVSVEISSPIRRPTRILTFDNNPLTFKVAAPPPPPNQIKFHADGYYIQLDGNTSLSTQLARAQALKAAHPRIRGFELYWYWGMMENPALVGGAAQYDGSWATGDQTQVGNQKGFKLLQTFLDTFAAMNCQLILHYFSAGGHSNGGDQSTTVWPSTFAPLYLSSSAYGLTTRNTTNSGLWGGIWVNSYPGNNSNFTHYYRFWDQRVMDRMIAHVQAYGAQFDAHPNFECFSFLDESSIPSDTGATDSQTISTFMGPNGMFQAFRAAMPHTGLRWYGNYMQFTSTMDQFLQAVVDNKWWVGGPDTANEKTYVAGDPGGTSNGQWRGITADFRWRGFTEALQNGGVRDNTAPSFVGIGGNEREIEGEDLSWDNTILPNGGRVANSRNIGDGVPYHIVAQGNLCGAQRYVLFDNTFTGPDRNRTNGAHPNILDWMDSMIQGGNINVNGAIAGITVANNSRPPGW